jgi:hypothetical protein
MKPLNFVAIAILFLISSIFTLPTAANPFSETSETALIFRPIFQDVKTKIPRDLAFRLPKYFPKLTEELEPTFSISDRDIVTVTLVYKDDRCRSMPRSSRGYLVGCQVLSISSGSINSGFWRQNIVTPKGTVFNLAKNNAAKHIQGDGWGTISWAQNGIFFSVYGSDRLFLGEDCNTAIGRACDFKFGELVKIARSMARQPIILRSN